MLNLSSQARVDFKIKNVIVIDRERNIRISVTYDDLVVIECNKITSLCSLDEAKQILDRIYYTSGIPIPISGVMN